MQCQKCGGEMKPSKFAGGKPYCPKCYAEYKFKQEELKAPQSPQTQSAPINTQSPTTPRFVAPSPIFERIDLIGKKMDKLTEVFSYFIQIWKESNPSAAEIHKKELEIPAIQEDGSKKSPF